MLANVTPRFIPHKVDEQLHAVIFADAYVKVGEKRHKAGHIPEDLALPPQGRDDNGWVYVVRTGNQVIFCHGITPILNQITSRKAFIYALEIFAQLMAILSLARRLPENWLAFIEAAFWGTAARRGWRPRFTGVECKANIADAVSRETCPGLSGSTGHVWTTTRTPSSASSPEQPETPTTQPTRRWTT